MLRRIGRHVRFVDGRVVVALVRLSRTYVDRTAWINAERPARPARDTPQRDVQQPGSRPAQPPALEVSIVHAYALLQPALASIAPDKADHPPTHGIAMVHCRRGRVVWLPSDEVWFGVLAAEAGRHRLPVAEVFLVTEFGWRCHSAHVAGSRPALAAA
jgi:hypothetical protein